MRKISELLRLRFELKLGYRDIAKSLGISISTVSDYLARAKAAGISWPLPLDMSDADLYTQLFLPVSVASRNRTGPDWQYVHTQLRKKASRYNCCGENIVSNTRKDLGIHNFATITANIKKH
jgi:hypothetical protein